MIRERPIIPKTIKIHSDQLESIKKIASLLETKDAVIYRLALDEGIEAIIAKENLNLNRMRRIFIDSDVIQKDELRTAQRRLALYLMNNEIPYIEDVFDEVVDFAWHEGEKAWEAVKSADEIYANTSLIPLLGYGSYSGSVVVMDVMMAKAIKENIKGKSIFFMRPYKDVEWERIDISLLDKAFKNNFLYTFEDGERFEQVDIDALVREHNLNIEDDE